MITDFPKRHFRLTASLLGAGLLLVTVWLTLIYRPVQATSGEVIIDPALAMALETADPNDYFDIIVYGDEPESKIALDLPTDKLARRVAVAENLKEYGTLALSGLTNRLEQEKILGNITSFRLLWIVNAVQVTARRDAIEDLGDHADVRLIILDQKIQLIKPGEVTTAKGPISLTWGVASTAQNLISLTWGLDLIGLNYAWHGLGFDGDGVTVAIMDTGVDWLHPDLINNYRGNSGAAGVSHPENWFDAVESSPAPIDPSGHGTHVAGTAVGANGIGVAPGAEWIGVRVLDAAGYGRIGDIHAGFQWLLAPNGDPTKSPDLVNNSWSGGTDLVEFIADVAALQSAGIIPIFATGNQGPSGGSVGSPASYPDTIAVGASDDQDLVTWFSGRGPSPHTQDPKPTLVAPGTYVFSALPNGEYGYSSGTSMATPHVVGVYALLLSAKPELTENEATAIITRTAVAIDNDQPNPDSGWGRVDAYAALSEVAESGLIDGTVVQGVNPIHAATILITNSFGITLPFESRENGAFTAHLAPGEYRLKIEKFAYSSYPSQGLSVVAGETININADLAKLAGGQLHGQLLDSTTQTPISGTVQVLGTPLTTIVNESGRYSFSVPFGRFELVASALGHHNEHEWVDISAGDVQQNFQLVHAPRILLVDSGNWYYHNQLDYISDAIAELDISFSIWPIRDPFSDIPSSKELAKYDVVIWSAPLDSPGYIGAGSSLSNYLSDGGNVLITGQNVGRWDGNPSWPEPWFYSQLKGDFESIVEIPQALTGEPGTLFTGLNLELNGSDSAGNQVSLDSSRPRKNSFTQVAFRYDDGSTAALQASQCEPFRIIYLGFGLEGVSEAANREEIISRSFDYFAAPETQAGVSLSPNNFERLVAAGTDLKIDVTLTNLSETITDTFQLTLAHDDWPARVITDSLTLGPCAAGETSLSIMAPTDLPLNSFDELELVATSSNSPAHQFVMPIRLKTPGQILLVDDDRWYDQEDHYRGILEELGYRHDVWDTSYPPDGNGSPPGELVNQYDLVIWYTAYDWFEPLTDFESQTLYNYLDSGGRLFLTSQDYLYYRATDPLTIDFLGIRDYLESVEPVNVFGNLPLGMPVGPLALDYGQYKNFSDGLVPSPSAKIFAWHDRGAGAAVANSGDDWRSVFWGLPFEKLPQDIQPETMRQIMGWLSDFGDTTFESGSRTGNSLSGEDFFQTYTITIRNTYGQAAHHAVITNTIPPSLTIDGDSITGGANYDPSTRMLTWAGNVDSSGSWIISYGATLATVLSPGARIDNNVSVLDTKHGLSFERSAPFWVAAADLTPSSIEISPTAVTPGDLAIIQVNLQNDGNRSATVSTTVHIAPGMMPITPTLSASLGLIKIEDQHLSWELELAPHQVARATMVISATRDLERRWLPTTMIIQDGVTDPIVRDTLLEIRPYEIFFPVMHLAHRP